MLSSHNLAEFVERPQHVLSHDLVRNGLVDVLVAAMEARVAAHRVAAVVNKKLALQPGGLVVNEFQRAQSVRLFAFECLGSCRPLIVVLRDDDKRIGFGPGHNPAYHAIGKADIFLTPRQILPAQQCPHVPAECEGAVHHVFAGDAVDGRSSARSTASGNCQGNCTSHIRQVRVENRRQDQSSIRDLFRDCLALLGVVNPVVGDTDLLIFAAIKFHCIASRALYGFDEVPIPVNKNDPETCLPGQQAHVAAPRGSCAK